MGSCIASKANTTFLGILSSSAISVIVGSFEFLLLIFPLLAKPYRLHSKRPAYSYGIIILKYLLISSIIIGTA